jgi:hypothetical protein
MGNIIERRKKKNSVYNYIYEVRHPKYRSKLPQREAYTAVQ